MVKDFNSTGFTVSEEFMTNADTPTLATESIIENPTNPFTGKPINSDRKLEGELFIPLLEPFNVELSHSLTQFESSSWLSVKDDIRDHSNWSYHPEKTLIPSAATK